MRNVVRKPDGSWTIEVEGTTYHIPADIEILRDKGDWFLDIVRDRVEAACGKEARYLDFPLIDTQGDSYLATSWKVKDTLFYIVLQNGKHIGWVEYRSEENRLYERYVALLPKYQRRGVYTALTKLLKKYVAPVILSDRALTISNALRWMKHGVFDQEHRRFRVNPGRRPTKHHLKEAVRFLLNRSHTEF